MMAYPEPPAFYPLLSMPSCDPSFPRNVCPPPNMRPYTPPSPMLQNGFPPPPNMPSPFPPMSMPLRPFPPPPPPNMQRQGTPPPPPLPPMQRPFTPPPSAPSTPPPILPLDRQNEILTQRWQWLPPMLCSLRDDHSGDIYKIISINWDGSSKEFYIKRQLSPGGPCEKEGKDVPEGDLIPPAPQRQFAPPPPPPPPFQRQEMTPPPSNSGFDREEAPIQIIQMNNSGHFPGPESPRAAYVEDGRSDDDFDHDDYDEYQSKPPLSPAMAERGRFPADDEYWASNQSFERQDERYESQGFISLGEPASSLSRGERSERSERSEKRSHDGKKHRKRHSSKEKERERERDGEKKKSGSKSRSRRSSSSKSDEKREDKRDSSHRDSSHRGRKARKPGLVNLLHW